MDVRTLLCGVLLLGLVEAAGAQKLPEPVRSGNPLACGAASCSMPVTGAYPHLVIGLYRSAATTKQAETLFSQMRSFGRWGGLPSDASRFARTLQPVSIGLDGGAALAVLITREEYEIAKPKPGDLVRYSPHRGSYEIPPDDPAERAYWSVDGCVAVLCRVGDQKCYQRYRQGVYRASDGVSLSPHDLRPIKGAPSIDPESLLPRS